MKYFFTSFSVTIQESEAIPFFFRSRKLCLMVSERNEGIPFQTKYRELNGELLLELLLLIVTIPVSRPLCPLRLTGTYHANQSSGHLNLNLDHYVRQRQFPTFCLDQSMRAGSRPIFILSQLQHLSRP